MSYYDDHLPLVCPTCLGEGEVCAACGEGERECEQARVCPRPVTLETCDACDGFGVVPEDEAAELDL